MGDLPAIVRAVVEAVLSEQLGIDEVSGLPFVDETAAGLERRIAQLPAFLGLGIRGMTLAFDRSALLTEGGRFRGLPLDARRRHLARWKDAPLNLPRNLPMFFEKMTVFVYYCHVEDSAGHTS